MFITKVDLVCEGGGVKGIGLLGAICALEENGYTFQRFAGTSAGAIVASLLAVGYTGMELKDILFNLTFKSFFDKNTISLLPLLGENISLLKNKGILSGNSIEKYLHEMFSAKNKVKFKDISNNGVSPLKIMASNITKKELVVLPDDLIKYNIDPMDFEIAKAVRMSISYPLYFNPVILTDGKNKNYIVDGGLLSNYPVWIFDTKDTPNWPTFGLKLVSDSELSTIYPKHYSIFDYASDIIETLLRNNEEMFITNKDLVRTISIRTYNIETMQFPLSKNDMNLLFNSGYTAAENFLKTWNFDSYLYRYRVVSK